MREVFADFTLLERLPNGKRRIRLPSQTVQRYDLRDGEQVLLIEYGSLRAPAYIHCVEECGAKRWYAEIAKASDIEEIDASLPSLGGY